MVDILDVDVSGCCSDTNRLTCKLWLNKSRTCSRVPVRNGAGVIAIYEYMMSIDCSLKPMTRYT